MTDSENLDEQASAAAALIHSVASSDFKEIAVDAADIGVDLITNSRLLEDIPIVKWLFTVPRAFRSIRDELFLKKIMRFLSPQAAVSEEARLRFVQKMDADPALRQRVGEAFLLWLERLNSMARVPLLAQVFRSLVLDEISFDTAGQFADIIDRIHLPYLGLVQNASLLESGVPQDPSIRTHFISLGMVQIEANWAAVQRQMKLDKTPRDIELLKYRWTRTAQHFANVILADGLPAA